MHYQETRGSQEEKARKAQIKSDTKFDATKIGDRLYTDCQGYIGLDLAWRMSEGKSTCHTTNRVCKCRSGQNGEVPHR